MEPMSNPQHDSERYYSQAGYAYFAQVCLAEEGESGVWGEAQTQLNPNDDDNRERE